MLARVLCWPMCCASPLSQTEACQCSLAAPVFSREFSKPLLPVGRAGVLLSEILHLLCRQMVSVRPFDHVGRAVTAVELGFCEQSRLGSVYKHSHGRRAWPLLGLVSVRGAFALLLPMTLGRNYPVSVGMGSCTS